ncbi:pTP [Red-eared slider adenovirus 1]|uniref:pTP n=1 Tax=Red-eared slider adenovirus 1 TaxID=2749458 RepID=UPI002481F20F|nr:pTP [Red-eared slider adenovirus 1]QLD28999.1 pTP [Red-eared slider adenovirus 1]
MNERVWTHLTLQNPATIRFLDPTLLAGGGGVFRQRAFRQLMQRANLAYVGGPQKYNYQLCMIHDLRPDGPFVRRHPIFHRLPPPHLLVGYARVVQLLDRYDFSERRYGELTYRNPQPGRATWHLSAHGKLVIDASLFAISPGREFGENFLQLHEAILMNRVRRDLEYPADMQGFGLPRQVWDLPRTQATTLTEDFGRGLTRRHLLLGEAPVRDLIDGQLLKTLRSLETALANYLYVLLYRPAHDDVPVHLPSDSDWLQVFLDRMLRSSAVPQYCAPSDSGRRQNQEDYLRCLLWAHAVLESRDFDHWLRLGPGDLSGGVLLRSGKETNPFRLRLRPRLPPDFRRARTRVRGAWRNFVDRLPRRTRRPRGRPAPPAPPVPAAAAEAEEDIYADMPPLEGDEEEEEPAAPRRPPRFVEDGEVPGPSRARSRTPSLLLEEDEDLSSTVSDYVDVEDILQNVYRAMRATRSLISELGVRHLSDFAFGARLYRLLEELRRQGLVTDRVIQRFTFYYSLLEYIASCLFYLHREFVWDVHMRRNVTVHGATLVLRGFDAQAQQLFRRVFNVPGFHRTQEHPTAALFRRVLRDVEEIIRHTHSVDEETGEIAEGPEGDPLREFTTADLSGDPRDVLEQVNIREENVEDVIIDFQLQLRGQVGISRNRQVLLRGARIMRN